MGVCLRWILRELASFALPSEGTIAEKKPSSLLCGGDESLDRGHERGGHWSGQKGGEHRKMLD